MGRQSSLLNTVHLISLEIASFCIDCKAPPSTLNLSQCLVTMSTSSSQISLVRNVPQKVKSHKNSSIFLGDNSVASSAAKMLMEYHMRS